MCVLLLYNKQQVELVQQVRGPQKLKYTLFHFFRRFSGPQLNPKTLLYKWWNWSPGIKNGQTSDKLYVLRKLKHIPGPWHLHYKVLILTLSSFENKVTHWIQAQAGYKTHNFLFSLLLSWPCKLLTEPALAGIFNTPQSHMLKALCPAWVGWWSL